MRKATGERTRTTHSYNLHLINDTHCDPTTDLPTITPTNYIPTQLIPFNEARTSKNSNAVVHFFVDDYQFERTWRHPEQYINTLKKYPATLSPDFSLYWDMPAPMQIWNTYRSRALAHYWQTQGITVIPTLQWAWPSTMNQTLAGIKGGTVAVATTGCHTQPEKQRWINGMTTAIHHTQPDHVIIYGRPIKEMNWQGVPHTYINNSTTTRMEEHRGRKRK